ncbi:MAG: hypothetical protein WC342_08805 [Methanoregula sp.]|jgi:purine-nucleoside phosphorylase
MEYSDLLTAIEHFGSTREDMGQMVFGRAYDKIQDRVIIAPWWEPPVFSGLGELQFLSESEHAAVKIWNVVTENSEITYIKTGIGAPVLTDAVLALGTTPCKKALFVGSVGALDPRIGIGDIVIPEYSVSGVGICRYLENGPLKSNNTFGEKWYPDSGISASLKNAARIYCDPLNVRYHSGVAFSTDTIFAQFAHLDEIIGFGCNVIEMETAPAFRAAALSGIALGALFSVSDNTLVKKSLYYGRTHGDNEYRKKIRRIIFPKIILDALK